MEISLSTFITSTARDMRCRGQFSAAKTCLSVLHGLCDVTHTQSLTFAELTPGLLAEYQHHLTTNGLNRNTVSLYLRTLHSLCNRAKCEGVTQLPDNLFDNLFTGTDPVAHRAVGLNVIRQVMNVDLTGKKTRLEFARDMFMLSLYLRGIAFVDLAHLSKQDQKDGVITYRRRKTKKITTVTIEPCAREIIERYASLTENTNYLLPIIRKKGTTAEEQLQYESALRLYNKHLGRITEVLALDTHLTSYVARHSWATAAHDIGVGVVDISEALCHSSEKMTWNYIRSFTPDRLAEISKRVTRYIIGAEQFAKDENSESESESKSWKNGKSWKSKNNKGKSNSKPVRRQALAPGDRDRRSGSL